MNDKKPWNFAQSFLGAALTALLLFAIPASLAAKLTDEQRLEMKQRVQREIEQGKVPEIKPGMSIEERVYIRKKQQALEQQKQVPPTPPPVPAAPPAPPAPPPRPPEQVEHNRHHHHDSPSYRPFEDRFDRYPSSGHDWRRERCLRLWRGGGYEYARCLDGDDRYLYPEQYEQRETTIHLDRSPPPPAVPFIDPDGPMNLRAGNYPVWYEAELRGEAVIGARNPGGSYRRFHLVGVDSGRDEDFAASCIADRLGDGTVWINEVSSASRYDGADAEAVVFSGETALNVQVLADGCAEFDARTCNDLDLDFCDELQEAENAARRNKVGIWQ